MAYVSSNSFLKCLVILLFMLSNTLFAVAQCNEPFFTSLGTTLCNMTPYPDTCYSTLAPPISRQNTCDLMIIYNLLFQVSEKELLRTSMNFAENGIVSETVKQFSGERVQLALQSCRKLLDLALYYLNWTTRPSDLGKVETRERCRIQLSGVGSLLKTCKDEFDYTPDEVQKVVHQQLKSSVEVVTNCLAIICGIDNQIRISNKDDYLLDNEQTSSSKHMSEWPPMWLSDEDKMLLEISNECISPNVIVASDGSGDFTNITAALTVVPSGIDRRFIIYVKAGVYNENVIVEKDKWNVLVYGDGMGKTIVSSNRNSGSGIPTFNTSTFAVLGMGFIAAYMTFQNTAGLNGSQAVALLAAADRIVFYRCSMDGYQDTLYAHTMVQFYRECTIYGTVDVIFGYAAIVIQDSTIYAKRPIPGQQNAMIAQGKDNAWSYSGFSIQHCRFLPAENLTGVQTFLGRPWFDYSTAVIMESYLDSLIDPKGWVAFTGVPVPPSTIYFAEYMNTGPGSDTSSRADWPGVKQNISSVEASKFTVRSFIAGVGWLPGTGVPFQADL